jgi:hypothetical protein
MFLFCFSKQYGKGVTRKQNSRRVGSPTTCPSRNIMLENNTNNNLEMGQKNGQILRILGKKPRK